MYYFSQTRRQTNQDETNKDAPKGMK